MKLYGSMVIDTHHKSHSPHHPINGTLSPSRFEYDEERLVLAKESLKLLKSHRFEPADRPHLSSLHEPNRLHQNPLFQPGHPLEYDETPVGHHGKKGKKAYFNPIYFYKGDSESVNQRSRFQTEPFPPLYECPCKCGRVMTSIQLQGHAHSCELMLKYAANIEANADKTHRPRDPLMELLNSVPRLKHKNSQVKQPQQVRISRVLGVPVQSSTYQPTSYKQNKQESRAPTRGNIKCPYCLRIFGAAVGNRHIQFCSYPKKTARSRKQ